MRPDPTGDDPAAYCPGCGRPADACGGCLWEYDPPHFCPSCGDRLAVNVSPAGWRARCKRHGAVVLG